MEYDKITECHLPRSHLQYRNPQVVFSAMHKYYLLCIFHSPAVSQKCFGLGDAACGGNPFSPQQWLSQQQLTETGAGTYINTTLEPLSGFLLKLVMWFLCWAVAAEGRKWINCAMKMKAGGTSAPPPWARQCTQGSHSVARLPLSFFFLGIHEAPTLTASSQHYEQEHRICTKKISLFC